jgi:hypothetical protein
MYVTYTPGDYRFQIVTEHDIFIYKLEYDEDDHLFRPKLETTITNYMKCSQLLISKSGEFAVAFKYD